MVPVLSCPWMLSGSGICICASVSSAEANVAGCFGFIKTYSSILLIGSRGYFLLCRRPLRLYTHLPAASLVYASWFLLQGVFGSRLDGFLRGRCRWGVKPLCTATRCRVPEYRSAFTARSTLWNYGHRSMLYLHSHWRTHLRLRLKDGSSGVYPDMTRVFLNFLRCASHLTFAIFVAVGMTCIYDYITTNIDRSVYYMDAFLPVRWL